MIQQEITLYDEPKPVTHTYAQGTWNQPPKQWPQAAIDAAVRAAIAAGYGVGAQFHYKTSPNIMEVQRCITDPKEVKTFNGGPAILECKYLNGTLGFTWYALTELLRADMFELVRKSPINMQEENNDE